MACITALEQDPKSGAWSGVSLRSGEAKKFNTLDDYRQYVKALEDKGTYCANIDPQYAVRTIAGQNDMLTGFLEFRPRDPIAQAKYDAMSSSWEGVESSEAAVARGDYSLDSAEKTRSDLRGSKTLPLMPQPVATSWNCSIQ